MHRYRVTALYKGRDYMIHDALSNEQIYDDELIEELGRTSSFNFAIPPDHENIGSLVPLTTRIFVTDNGKEIYDGRVVGDKRDIINTGVIQTYGAMSYLMDTQQEPTAYTGGITAFMDMMLARHNEACEMQFTRGEVTVTDSNDYINRSWSEYTPTLRVMTDKLVKTHGGYFRVRHISGNHYKIDYLSEFGDNSQVVRLGENLIDIQSQVDAAEVYTRIIPLGAEIQSTEETEIKEYTTIESVNEGKKYIESADLKAKYGTITQVVHWDNVTEPANLLKKAIDYLAGMEMPKTFDVKIVDLSMIDDEVQAFEVGKMTRVLVPTQGVDLRYQMTKYVRHLTAPQNDSVTLGPVQKTITQLQAQDIKNANDKITHVDINTNNNIVNTGKTITGAKGGYVVLDAYDSEGKLIKPWRILIMDQEDKNQAQNVIQLNVNGIGFSTTGIDGPYRNAWTIDGVLSADFIRTGSLVFGGSAYNTDGALIIKDAQDNVIGTWDKNGLAVLKGIIQGVSAIFGGVNNQNGAIEVQDSGGQRIGRWDNDGLSVLKGLIQGATIKGADILGGSIDIGDGTFTADDGGVRFGDYQVSANGTNELESINGWVKINTNEKPSGSPGGRYASLFLSGDGYLGMTLKGTGEIKCGGVECGDVFADSCQLAHGSYLWGLGATIDWFWEQFEELRDKVDNL